MRELWVADLGLRRYADVLEIQRTAAAARITGEIPQDLLILCEHHPVVTLGRSARDSGHLMASPVLLAARGLEVFEVERGGDITFHGPGQLVGYPIIDLSRHKRDLHWYLRQLEEVLIRSLRELGVDAGRRPALTGVWTEGRKIASIGVHSRHWVTWHGFALNVATDLSWFDLMVPCGIPGVQMTSVANELLRRADATCIAPPPALAHDAQQAVIEAAGDVFELSAVQIDESALAVIAAAP